MPADLLASTLVHDAARLNAPQGLLLFDEGATCIGFPMALYGELRVASGSQNGRSLELNQ